MVCDPLCGLKFCVALVNVFIKSCVTRCNHIQLFIYSLVLKVYFIYIRRFKYKYLITLIPGNITSQLQCISVSAAGTSAVPVTDE